MKLKRYSKRMNSDNVQIRKNIIVAAIVVALILVVFIPVFLTKYLGISITTFSSDTTTETTETTEEDTTEEDDDEYVYIKPEINNDSDIKKSTIINVFKNISDPEIGIDIYNFGLVREVDVDEDNNIEVTIVVTTLSCPYNDTLLEEIADGLSDTGEFNDIDVSIDKSDLWEWNYLTEYGMEQMEELYGW